MDPPFQKIDFCNWGEEKEISEFKTVKNPGVFWCNASLKSITHLIDFSWPKKLNLVDFNQASSSNSTHSPRWVWEQRIN